MASVTGVAPMAARSVDRMRDEFPSLQSCRIMRITHTSPGRGRGSVSAPLAHSQALLAAVSNILNSVNKCLAFADMSPICGHGGSICITCSQRALMFTAVTDLCSMAQVLLELRLCNGHNH